MLENFRAQKIIWDRANKKIFEKIEANSGDSNGRKLVVQVINQEATENLSGTTLSLGWKCRNGAKGLDAFDVVDASKGIFEIYYTTEMLSNIGNIEASLILIDSTSRIESSTFTISVRPSTVDDESVESENSFTALTEALVKVNDFDAQLAQKPNKDEVRLNTYQKPINVSEMDTETKQLFTGGAVAVVGYEAVGRENIKPRAVGVDKVDFLNPKKNLFNGHFVNGMIRVPVNALENMEIISSYDPYIGRTAVIPIEPNETYTVKIHNTNLKNVFRIAIMNAYPVFDTIAKPVDTPVIFNDSLNQHTFTNTGNGKYALIYVSNSGKEPPLQIEKGATASPYEEYGLKIDGLKIEREDIESDAIDYSKRTKVGDGGFLVSFGGSVDFDLINRRMYLPNSTHVFTGTRWIRLIGASGTPVFYDLPIDNLSIWLMYFNAKSSNNELDFVFRRYNEDNSDLQDYILLGVLASGTNRYAHINGNYTINGRLPIPDKSITAEKIADGVLNSGVGITNQYHYYDELKGTFITPTGLEDKSADLDTTVPNDIYALYDNLMSLHPKNITRRTLGYSQLADGTADTTLPIYEYTFKPFRGDASTSVKVPRILIQAGIHGYEKISVWATWKWFENLLNGVDEVTTFMRNNIDFHVVPIANPYSYYHNIRHNINGVDINTNFEMDWYLKENSGSPGSLYGGEEPMSEMETQVLDGWYSEFEGNCIGFIDMHNTGIRTTSKGSYGLCWYISGDEGVRTMSRNILNAMSRKWRVDFPELDANPNDVMYGDVSERTDGTARNQAYKKYGILSLSLDPSWYLSPLVTGANKYSPESLHINIDVLGASVIGFVKNFGQ